MSDFLFGCAGLLVLVIIAYWPALHAGFVWDDDFMLTNNPAVKSPAGLRYIWFSTALPDYFPLTSTSLWLEWKIWGMKAWGYHITNVLLHVFSVIVSWRVFRVLRIPASWVIAAVFAVHPMNVESVVWIAERKNVLAMCFYALTWYAIARSWGAGNEKSKGVLGWYFLSLAFFLLALLSKTAVVMYPVVLLLCVWWKKRKVAASDILRTAPFFALSLGFGLLTMWFQSHRAIAGDFADASNFGSRLVRAGWAFWFYLYKAILPFRLTFVYPEWHWHGLISLLPIIALVVLLALLFRYRRTWGRHALFGLGYFGIMLLPVLGFIPIYFQRYSLVANHWVYFALPGIIALLVTGALYAARRIAGKIATGSGAHAEGKAEHSMLSLNPVYTWIGNIGAASVVLLLAFLSFDHAGSFENSERLWRETLRVNPDAWMAQNNLGHLLAAEKRYEEAMEHYVAALRLQPNQTEIRLDLGSALLDTGRLNEAEEQFNAALKIDPKCAMAYYNLGNTEDRRGNHANAIANFEHALQIDPKYAEAYNNLGCLIAADGQLENATAYFRKAVAAKPDYADACNNLGSTLTEQGRWLEALSFLRRAIELNPAYADPHYNLANALSLGGKLSEARQEYLNAVQMKPSFAEAHVKLGTMLMNEGNAQGAYNELTTAVRLRPDIPEGHYRLGTLLATQRQYGMAIEQYKLALQLNPDWPDVLSQLAWIYATTGDATVRNGEQALQLASRAADLTSRKDPGPLDALAAAHAELGQFTVAVNMEEEAANIAEQAGLAEAVHKCRTRLEMYRQNKPWRE